MMRLFLMSARLLLLAVAAMTLSGCFYSGQLHVRVFEGIVSISVGDPELEGNVNIGACFEDEELSAFHCDIRGITSSFEVLTLPELIVTLVVLDPLVVQFPDGVTNFSGSFQHVDSGTNGTLEITPGLASVPIDVDRTLVAEPGTQLVIIGLPKGTATTGHFAFRLNFAVPPGTSAIEVKPIITGLVELTDGSVFYPPILPCVDDMANAPALTVTVSGDGFVSLPAPTADLACENEVYNFIPDGDPAPAEVLIDIKPGSFPNSINLGSRGTVPIAILSTATFDAQSVDPTTVTLASAPVQLKGNGAPMASAEDVNGDGRADLVVHVSTEALELDDADTEAVLEGMTFGGTAITGTDTIRVVQ